jgi:hypothetical protein
VGSKAWVSAYVAKSKQRVGVYLTFERGPIAERLFEALRAEKESIEAELGMTVRWEDEGGGQVLGLGAQDCSGCHRTGAPR